jgi:hypothetical protein
MLEPDYCKARLLEIGVGRRFWQSNPSPENAHTFYTRVVQPLRPLQRRGVVEAVDLRASEVAESSSRITLQSNGSLARDIGERGNKFQKTVFSANHEANDCDFRLFSTECDKLHLCGKV